MVKEAKMTAKELLETLIGEGPPMGAASSQREGRGEDLWRRGGDS